MARRNVLNDQHNAINEYRSVYSLTSTSIVQV